MSDAADQRIAELEKELWGVQEMLFLVLEEVGEPVRVKTAGKTVNGDRIIDVHRDGDDWVFSVVDHEQ